MRVHRNAPVEPDGRTIRNDVQVTWIHRYEYSTQREDGTWNAPEIRYHNPTDNEAVARKRHESCHHVEYEFGRLFEGIYGYRWANCQLVKRTTISMTIEEDVFGH